MNSRRAGLVFLVQIVISIGVSLGLSFGIPSFDIPIVWNLILSELLLVLPGVIALLALKRPIRETVSFRGMKLTSFLLVIVFTVLMMPMIAFANAFSMIFTDNTVKAISGEILEKPYLLILFLIGIYGPFCEEFVFRGVIFGGLKKTGKILGAILLQGLLFGIMHLNFNQFCYAFIIGIAIGLLTEVTESIWSGFLMHALINSSSVTLMYLTSSIISSALDTETQMSKSELIPVVVILGGFAFVSTALAGAVMYAISANENRKERFLHVFSGKKAEVQETLSCEIDVTQDNRLVHMTTICAIVLGIGFIILGEVLKYLNWV